MTAGATDADDDEYFASLAAVGEAALTAHNPALTDAQREAAVDLAEGQINKLTGR